MWVWGVWGRRRRLIRTSLRMRWVEGSRIIISSGTVVKVIQE
jgi:hypothetical protein